MNDRDGGIASDSKDSCRKYARGHKESMNKVKSERKIIKKNQMEFLEPKNKYLKWKTQWMDTAEKMISELKYTAL